MSKIFFDHLIVFEELEAQIEAICESSEEKEELWRLVDEIIHCRVLEVILDVLPYEYHYEFLTRFYTAPYEESHIKYLNERVKGSIEELIAEEIKKLEEEIIQELGSE